MKDDKLKLLKSKVMKELEKLDFPSPLTKEDIIDTLYFKYRIINKEDNTDDINIVRFLKSLNNLLIVDKNFFVLDDKYKDYVFEIISNNREKYKKHTKEFNEIIVKLNSIERNTTSLASYILLQESLRLATFEEVEDLKITMGFDYLAYKCIEKGKPLNDLAIILSTRYFVSAFPEIFTEDLEYSNKTKEYLKKIEKNSVEKRLRKASKKELKNLSLVLK